MAEFSPEVNLTVEDTLSGNGNEQNIALEFKSLKDFEPEQVAKNIPQLRVLLAMRNLLRDLKSNLLDNATFRRELENILKDRRSVQNCVMNWRKLRRRRTFNPNAYSG